MDIKLSYVVPVLVQVKIRIFLTLIRSYCYGIGNGESVCIASDRIAWQMRYKWYRHENYSGNARAHIQLEVFHVCVK